MQINLAFALSFPFHELHMRSMQIYEKLIVHVQIEIDFSVSCWQDGEQIFLQVQTF